MSDHNFYNHRYSNEMYNTLRTLIAHTHIQKTIEIMNAVTDAALKIAAGTAATDPRLESYDIWNLHELTYHERGAIQTYLENFTPTEEGQPKHSRPPQARTEARAIAESARALDHLHAALDYWVNVNSIAGNVQSNALWSALHTIQAAISASEADTKPRHHWEYILGRLARSGACLDAAKLQAKRKTVPPAHIEAQPDPGQDS